MVGEGVEVQILGFRIMLTLLGISSFLSPCISSALLRCVLYSRLCALCHQTPTPQPPRSCTYRLLVTLPTGCLCDLLYTLATATPRYSPQQLLLLLQLMPAWRTPPHAAVNAKRALVGAWFQATHRTLLLQQQQQQQMQPPAPPPAAAAAMQPPFVAAALKGLAAAHLRPPPAWLQLALSVLTQHLSLTSAAAAGSSQQQQQQQQQMQQWMHWQQQQFDPEELSRVVLALSKLGAQPEGQEAAVLLTATQVGNLAQGKELGGPLTLKKPPFTLPFCHKSVTNQLKALPYRCICAGLSTQQCCCHLGDTATQSKHCWPSVLLPQWLLLLLVPPLLLQAALPILTGALVCILHGLTKMGRSPDDMFTCCLCCCCCRPRCHIWTGPHLSVSYTASPKWASLPITAG